MRKVDEIKKITLSARASDWAVELDYVDGMSARFSVDGKDLEAFWSAIDAIRRQMQGEGALKNGSSPGKATMPEQWKILDPVYQK